MSRLPITPGGRLSPAVEDLLAAFERSGPRPLARREQIAEGAAAVLLVATGFALLAIFPNRPVAPSTLLVLIAAYAIARRIRFRAGHGYTMPTELVLVPMLFVLPAGLVPLCAAAGLMLGQIPEYLSRRTHPDRAILSVGDAWHAVGPALVLALLGSGEPEWSQWPVYLLALAAQFGVDFVASAAREWFALKIPPGLQDGELTWVFMVDALLAPVGFLAALACVEHPAAVLATLPLTGLLAFFARERSDRIDAALELSSAYRGTAFLLGDVIEADDEYTGDHSRGVVTLALRVADEMGLDPRERRTVEFGALLHDVGKIAIPKEMINKPGPLTDEEWVVMETHTIEGQRMLERVGGVLAEVGRIVRSSHEHWDGGGYPDGLAGAEIPRAALIVAACDAFSAMTTHRSYRPAMPVERALGELRANAGTQFCPAVVEVLACLVEREHLRGDGTAAPQPA